MYQPPSVPNAEDECLCGSGTNFAACCGPALSGDRPPATPEALMRSRYCAYVLADAAYLRATWHPRTRPKKLQLDDQPQWQRLEVTGSGVSEDGADGWVEFAAHYTAGKNAACLREHSRFAFEDGRWYYLDGGQPPVRVAPKPGRNEPCPCGSGRKFKQCCGR